MRAKRVVALAVLACALAAWGGWTLLERRHQAPRDVNVLLITLDTVRADRLGCYGHAAARTPALDRLAAGGVRFANTYAHVPLTLPSHATLLTGRLPPQHGLHDNGRGKLRADCPTLAELARARGYATAAFLGCFVLDRRFGLDRGFDLYDDRMAPPTDPGSLYSAENAADRVCDRALRWLETHAAKPFFCWVHFYDPHAPYRPPAAYRDLDPYDGEIAFVDAQVGRLMEWLERRGLRDRTVIVVAGDHGEAFGEHEEREHGPFVYDTCMRVPLILALPRPQAQTRVVDRPAGLADIVPTLADLLGWKPPAGLSGLSLLGRPAASRSLYGESEFLMNECGSAPLYSIITDNWKYIACPLPELYDLRSDPNEDRNQVATEPRRAQIMRDELARLRAELGRAAPSAAPLDPEALARLQSLGYLGHLAGPSQPGGDKERQDPKAVIRIYNACEKARGLRSAKRHEEAIALLAPLLAQSTNSPVLHLNLYQSYYALERWLEAKEQIEAYLRLRPHDRVLTLNLGTVLLHLGQPREAARVLEDALRLPRDPLEATNDRGVSFVALTLRIRLGLAWHRLDEPLKAIEQWELVLQDDPGNAQVHKSAAETYGELGQYDEAIPHYRAALHFGRNDPRLDAKALETGLQQALSNVAVRK